MINKLQPFSIIKKILTAAICLTSISVFFCSCKIYKPAYYFRDIKRDTVIAGFVTNDMELKIQKGDLLNISISSLSNAEDLLFNKAVSLSQTEGKSGFQVSPDGNIYVHKLGKVAAEGLTRKELKAKLETGLLPYLKDPIVIVNFANHRVTVLGDASSAIVEMPDERISLLEALAASKGTTLNSQLSQVMVIRETKDTKEIKNLNLEDPSIFTSSWYYLQPNDIVVVKPNEQKIEDEQKRTRNQLLYTSIITGISFLILIIDRIVK